MILLLELKDIIQYLEKMDELIDEFVKPGWECKLTGIYG